MMKSKYLTLLLAASAMVAVIFISGCVQQKPTEEVSQSEAIQKVSVVMECKQLTVQEIKSIFGYDFVLREDVYVDVDYACGSPWKLEDEEAEKLGISGIVEMTIRDKEKVPHYNATKDCEIFIKEYSGKSAGIEDVSCAFKNPYAPAPYEERYDVIFEKGRYHVSFICAGNFCNLDKLNQLASIVAEKI